MAKTTVVGTTDGREVAFCQWGVADGRPVLFLHGTPGGRLLRNVNGEYERTGVRVITYDRPDTAARPGSRAAASLRPPAT